MAVYIAISTRIVDVPRCRSNPLRRVIDRYKSQLEFILFGMCIIYYTNQNMVSKPKSLGTGFMQKK